MPNLVKLNIDYRGDLVKLPVGLCNTTTLKKLSISSCHNFIEIPQEIGNLENLELRRISHCTEFKKATDVDLNWLLDDPSSGFNFWDFLAVKVVVSLETLLLLLLVLTPQLKTGARCGSTYRNTLVKKISLLAMADMLVLVKNALSISNEVQGYINSRERLMSATKRLGAVIQQTEQGMRGMDHRDMDRLTQLVKNLKGLNEANQEVLDKNEVLWWNFCLLSCFRSKHEDTFLSFLSSIMLDVVQVMGGCLIELESRLTNDGSLTMAVPAQETDSNIRPIFQTKAVPAQETDSIIRPMFTKVTVKLGSQSHTMDKLKIMLLDDRGSQTLNLYGLPGSGKTTLAENLCQDKEVRDYFKDSIIFETLGSQIQSNEASIRLSKIPDSKLLVLDDVLPACENIIGELTNKRPGSKILVTSRYQITKLGTRCHMELLSLEDAEALFLHFVRPTEIDLDDQRIRLMLLQIVKGCKGLPFAIEFLGRNLRGKTTEEFQLVQPKLLQGSILDSHEVLLAQLQNCLHQLVDETHRECFMDLGLFPEDEKIPMTSLIDMWIELYNLDERGICAMAVIRKLTTLSLVAGINVRR
ncbi:probable disease resistance protein At4g33300 [Neltuma alba]|uniref:probable disease resistance protein At4g33300 n=1 Tax=Neltuma alba TaxID=207710 RepID=UPI0010A539AF|nr:probable disease resistance protein At4g33300 [Prosopis alba]